MILDALKNFGPAKMAKPGKLEKPGKKGAAPKMDKKKYDGDTGSKETIKDSSRAKEKKTSPPPPKKSPINTVREKTPLREKTPVKERSAIREKSVHEKTPVKKVTPISSRRGIPPGTLEDHEAPESEEEEELNEDSGDGESIKSIKRKRPSHLIDQNEALNLHRDAFNHMKEQAANYGRTMIHKKVSVDHKTKEFQEDSPKRSTPIGTVRNFVKELK